MTNNQQNWNQRERARERERYFMQRKVKHIGLGLYMNKTQRRRHDVKTNLSLCNLLNYKEILK